MKKENCCPFQILAVHQSQLFNQGNIRLLEYAHLQTTSTCCNLSEAVQSRHIQIINPNIWHGYRVPASAHFAHEESIQCSSSENLLCRTAPVMVLSPVADGYWVWFHCNAQIRPAILMQQFNTCNDSEKVAKLVRQLFHESIGIFYTYRLPVIIAPYFQNTALCIGKTAQPLHVFVLPGCFPFCILSFIHMTNSICHALHLANCQNLPGWIMLFIMR